jgi:hypothetical protein
MANLWMEGTGSDALEGGDNANTIDDKTTASLQDPLDRLLATLRVDCEVAYASSATVTIAAGSVSAQNSGATIRRFRQNTTATTLDITSDLDTGAEANSTWYYIWAVADADATTFTGVLSVSDSFPSGITYARLLGKFFNNSSGNIEQVQNSGDDTALHSNYNQRVKCWANIDGSDGTLNNSYNVTSCTRTATGKYTVTWATDFSDANYCCVATCSGATTSMRLATLVTYAVGSITVEVKNNSGTFANCTILNIMAIGNQA